MLDHDQVNLNDANENRIKMLKLILRIEQKAIK